MWENPRHCTPQSLIDPNISQCQITKTLSNSFAATVFVPTLSSGILLANSKYNHIYIYTLFRNREPLSFRIGKVPYSTPFGPCASYLKAMSDGFREKLGGFF